MRNFKRRARRMRFTPQYVPLVVVNNDSTYSFFKPVDGVMVYGEFGYHNFFEGKWIVIHVASGLMVKTLDDERNAKELTQKLEMEVKRRWKPDRKELAMMINVMRSIKIVSGHTLGVCFEDVTKPTDDIPF